MQKRKRKEQVNLETVTDFFNVQTLAKCSVLLKLKRTISKATRFSRALRWKMLYYQQKRVPALVRAVWFVVVKQNPPLVAKCGDLYVYYTSKTTNTQ